MSDVILQRGETGDWGTKGSWLIVATGWLCDSLELPERGNMPGISRICPGIFNVKLLPSAHFNRPIYHVLDVPGRDSIEIHNGTWAGDPAMGYQCQVRGCALQGRGYGYIQPYPQQLAILNSRITVDDFIKQMSGRDFTLEIKAAQNSPAG